MKKDRITDDIIAYLETYQFGAEVRIADAQAIDRLALPCVAVNVESMESYAAALPNVHRAEIVVTVRQHVGDDEDSDPTAIGDLIESIMHDCSLAKAAVSGCDFWQYQGATESFESSILTTDHRVSAVVR